MSRRHHGRPPHHAQGAAAGPRRAAGVSPGTSASPVAETGGGLATPAPRPGGAVQSQDRGRETEPMAAARPMAPSAPQPDEGMPAPGPGVAPAGAPSPETRPIAGSAAPTPGFAGAGADRNAQCTAPQLRRFIKSRPYVPMHELRRRFGIDGGDDDVTPVRLEPGWVYVGLPPREGTLLGELLRAGEIGYELSLDPRSPIVIGVYPMRPISRG